MAIPYVKRGKLIAADQQNALIDLVNQNADDIEQLKADGGGTPSDPFVDWFEGDGPPPSAISGAGLGDMYYDRVNRQLYQLQ